MDYASTVGTRPPRTFAALAAGQIHPVHLRIIEDETRVLTDADAAKADAILAEAAPGLTYGETRSAAHKLVLQLDPEAAKKRKEAARREAQVRRFREASGNAGMVAWELPSDEVLASWQHVEQRALDLRAAGLPGSLQELRVRAYLDLLQERDSRDLPVTPASAAGQPPSDHAPDQPSADSGPPAPAPAAGPSVAALVTLTIPLATYQGQSETPGQAAGLGLLDGDDARDLAEAAARHPRTRWCLTVVIRTGPPPRTAACPAGAPRPAWTARPAPPRPAPDPRFSCPP